MLQQNLFFYSGGASRNFDWLLVSKCQVVDKLGASSRYYFGIFRLDYRKHTHLYITYKECMDYVGIFSTMFIS